MLIDGRGVQTHWIPAFYHLKQEIKAADVFQSGLSLAADWTRHADPIFTVAVHGTVR